MHKTSRVLTLVVALLLVPRIAPGSDAQPTGQDDTTIDAQRLIQEIVNLVVEELRNGEFLQQQIKLGIEEYIKTQQEAQVAARAEQARLTNERVKNVRPVSRDRDHIYGNPDAAISLIEYSDFECPFCKRFHATPKEVVAAYGGQVNWVYRHFPLPFHNPGAQKQAEASECANELGGNDAFWAYSDAIYARTESNGNGFPLTSLAPLAAEIGLDEKQFQTCLDTGPYAERVREDVAEASQLGVNSTPTVIVRQNRTGEVRLRTGALSMDVFTADIEAMLGP